MFSHQPFDRAARNILLFSPELMPDLAGPVSAFAFVIDTLDVLQILRVLFRAVRGPLRIPGNGYVTVIGRWGDRQNAADRLDPKLLSVIVNERDHLRNGRSSSA